MIKILKSGFLKKVILISVFIVLACSTFAQTKIWNNWYFGNKAGLSFNTEPPTVLVDGQINTGEGCASISDENGNLLFYTNGVTVWDKNHNIMPNGMGLKGHKSTTQAALIVSYPQNTNLYYLFSIGETDDPNLYYSIIDLAKNNNDGDVDTNNKNILLLSNTGEKQTAIAKIDGTGYWLVSCTSNGVFHSYSITKDGLNITPVISNGSKTSFGEMEFSPDGEKLAFSSSCFDRQNLTSTDVKLDIYNFDNPTGIFSYEKNYELSNDLFTSVYGLEFSPDNSKLYATLYYGSASALLQFDMNNGEFLPDTISIENNFGAIELAPDGKLYIARSMGTFISCINNPNETADNCNFVLDAIDLSPNISMHGLPNIIQHLSSNLSVNLGDDINICQGEEIILDAGVGFDSYLWSTGEITQTISVSEADDYFVDVEMCGCVLSDTINVSFWSSTPTASKQSNIWYFGNKAGLDFNTEPPTVLTDGQVNAMEGCSVASDENGNLLFYTDGTTVWNRNHQIMPNGSGLSGHSSATQSAMIIKQSGNQYLYYIFTTGAADQVTTNGLGYSVVDISADNGFGEVLSVSKNTQLVPTTSEKITATSHSNGKDIWILSRNGKTNSWYAFLLTESGVSANPVISTVGISRNYGFGQAKASPDGNLIVSADLSIDTMNSQVEFFYLNKDTGELQLLATLPHYTYLFYYGIEFSPDGSVVYLNRTSYMTWQSDILQVKIINNIPDFTDINIIGTITYPSSYYLQSGALQIASNGKIYIARNNQYLSVIHNPNEWGANCNFQLNGVNLSPGVSIEGLPTLYQTFTIANSIHTVGECSLQRQFYVENKNCINHIIWNFGDGQTSTEAEPTHIYLLAGKYAINLEITYIDNTTETITKEIEIFGKPDKPMIKYD